MPKIKAPKISNPIKVIEKTVDTVVDKTVDTTKTVVNETTNVVATVTKSAEQVAKDAVATVNSTVLKPAGRAIVSSANDVAKKYNYASDEVTAGATVVAQEMEKGAYVVRDGAILVAEWVEANYCQIGMSVALGTIFAAMLYRPEPVSQAQTTATMAPLSAAAVAYLAAKETVGAVVVGTACDFVAGGFVELLWLDPNIRKGVGSANKEILTYAIAFSLSKAFDAAAGSFVVPQVGAAMVAGIVTSIATQLVCDGALPAGARAWAMTAADGA